MLAPLFIKVIEPSKYFSSTALSKGVLFSLFFKSTSAPKAIRESIPSLWNILCSGPSPLLSFLLTSSFLPFNFPIIVSNSSFAFFCASFFDSFNFSRSFICGMGPFQTLCLLAISAARFIGVKPSLFVLSNPVFSRLAMLKKVSSNASFALASTGLAN